MIKIEAPNINYISEDFCDIVCKYQYNEKY